MYVCAVSAAASAVFALLLFLLVLQLCDVLLLSAVCLLLCPRSYYCVSCLLLLLVLYVPCYYDSVCTTARVCRVSCSWRAVSAVFRFI